jgi:magnesium-transporting ATPase (P-type)
MNSLFFITLVFLAVVSISYGGNKLPERRKRAFYEYILDALEDKVLIILMIAAAVSLVMNRQR